MYFHVLFLCVSFALSFEPLTSSGLIEGNYTYTVANDVATITGFGTSYAGALSVPSTLGGYPVATLGSKAFYNCSKLTSIVIPGSVENIQSQAVYYCSSLSYVAIPSNVSAIGVSPFRDCTSLVGVNVDGHNAYFCSVDGVLFNKSQTALIQYPGGKTGDYAIPYGVKSIGNGAFEFCTKLTNIVISSSVTNLGDGAFTYTSLTNVIIPDGVTAIGNGTFMRCDKLATIVLPESLTSIGSGAFDANAITSLIIPNSVTCIGDGAFSSCVKLTNVVLSANVKMIGKSAFSSCGALRHVDLPDGVISIGEDAFYSCTNLACIIIPDGVTSIGDEAFYACSKLTSVMIPGSVTNIGNSAFRYCNGLTRVTIGGHVANIGQYAFGGCSHLVSVTMGTGVTRLGYAAFANNSKLTSIFFEGDAPTLDGTYVFNSTPCTVYYLSGASGWDVTFGGRPSLCWNPRIQHDAGFGIGADRFGFTIAGTTNIPLVVETSTNLFSRCWTPVMTTNLGAAGSLYFSDPFSPNAATRFYRIVRP